LGRKPKVSVEVKLQACKDYCNGNGSFNSIGATIGVHQSSVQRWVYSYREKGDSAFIVSDRNKSYTRDFKMYIINEYLNGNNSSNGLAAKYNITDSMVCKWVNSYNQGIEVKDYKPKPEVYTMKKRKTTFEERLEIVNYVLSNDKNYRKASLEFKIPYASVHLWTRKYLSMGEEGIKYNKRGRKTKDDVNLNSLSEIDRLKYELKIEKEKRELAELKYEVLKKKEELEKKAKYRK